MKDSLLLSLIFILILVSVFLVLTTFTLLHQWSIYHHPTESLSSGWIAATGLRAMKSTLPVSVILSIFLLFFRILKRPGNRILSFLLPVLLAAGALYGGGILFDSLAQITKNSSALTPEPFSSGRIHIIDGKYLYAGNVSNENIEMLLLIDPEKTPVFHLSAGGKIDWENRRLTSTDGELDFRDLKPGISPLLEPPAVLKDLFEDINMLNRDLDSLRTTSLSSFFLASLSISFFAMSCWGLAWITRMPLFNSLLTILSLRFIFLLYRVLSSEIISEFTHAFTKTVRTELLPAAVFMILGILLAIWDILFVPYNKKRMAELHG
ncbi:MAG: hypothetical protein KAU17_06890 [Spirochaetales bacterium]|nr:hypothetical protein [Spirochaetales bacterium]